MLVLRQRTGLHLLTALFRFADVFIRMLMGDDFRQAVAAICTFVCVLMSPELFFAAV